MIRYLRTYRKDPSAVKDYGIDWSDWLESADTIATSAWAVTAGITVDDDTQFGDDGTTVTLSGGTAGEEYAAKNTITTTSGLTEERSILIIVEEQ
jgi:hypothetical protein